MAYWSGPWPCDQVQCAIVTLVWTKVHLSLDHLFFTGFDLHLFQMQCESKPNMRNNPGTWSRPKHVDTQTLLVWIPLNWAFCGPVSAHYWFGSGRMGPDGTETKDVLRENSFPLLSVSHLSVFHFDQSIMSGSFRQQKCAV